MSRLATARRSLAGSAVLALVACGAAAVPAFADPGNGNGGASASAPGQVKDKDKKDKGDKPGQGQGHQGQGHQGQGHQGQGHGQGQGGGKGHQGNPGQGNPGNQGGNGNGNQGGNGNGNQGGNGNAGGAGDPAGNNGTVKIAGLGELDGIPNNTPHPGCTFQVEWYGFDEGPDVVSQVSFAMHAPTSDVALSVAGDTSVFVGGDPASGAGTDSGLDGVETYTLTFDGAPHPKQGYHLKLTVATPRSQGNDTKTKVFWIEPCETAPVEETPVEETPVEETPAGETPAEETPGDTGVLPSEEELAAEGEQGVLGTNSEISENQLNAAGAAADSAEVPTNINAGEEGTFSSFSNFASSPLGLLIVGLGVLIAAAGVLARRRSGDSNTI
ncbi:hypothetical protein NSZ01_02280 [Nocardioides szechwanensis]|uniref:LPXTG-motif cell wall anchor domain-containing protein n=1 Tax=Nocardioides szechwanensis TaxID=1005944 RepID=A0A1G9X1F0_9ACTN|nr:hypothetical protein [Nocardioides szechwanensis]GEP32460.1 hypothetical protein NSZ01_02280 [Nocardioides szechwanensis]SDM90518.1 hypothetical protein SAMN05192576_1227 [Nocardioides szechwanensis]